MPRLLIVDAGSSKTDWSFLSGETGNSVTYTTPGINPILQSYSEISQIIQSAKDNLDNPSVDRIFFYGAGCVSSNEKHRVKEILQQLYPVENIVIESDIIGASKALFGDGEGLTCILGTGSNTSLYSKGEIIKSIPSLGFILGDEGSGAAFGKRLINAVFKKQLPEHVIRDFDNTFNLSYSDIVNRVYQQPMPSTFLASFFPFICQHYLDVDIQHLIKEELKDFFLKNILPYKLDSDVKIGFIGSVAALLKDKLEEVANDFGIKINKIIKAPMEYLQEYHLKQSV